MTDDREKLEEVARLYREYYGLIQKQHETTALMLRACIAQLTTTSQHKRREALTALTQLAEMFEVKRDASATS